MSTAPLLQTAIELHQQGRFSEAEQAYRQILNTETQNADALALLGCVLSEQQKHEAAVAAIAQALKLDPQAALFHFHLGNAYSKANDAVKAIAAFQRATEIAPTWPDAWYNLANSQRQLNRTREARASYAHVLGLAPNHALTHNNLALVYLKDFDLAKARTHAEEAVRLSPNDPQIYLTLNDVAFEQNDLPVAITSAERAIALRLGLQHANLSVILNHAAITAPVDEQMANCLLALAVGYMTKGNLPEADALVRLLISLEPDMEEAFSILGGIALARNKLDVSEEAYAQSFMLDPSYTGAPWNRSVVQLTRGQLQEGFRRARWRWHALDKFKKIALEAPRWDGVSDMRGKILLIHEEQGFGDSLQMLRFVPALKARGIKIWIYARAPLYALIKDWKEADKVILWNGEKKPPAEVTAVCGVMDLPGLVNANFTNLPAAVPYLPNPKKGGAKYTLEGDGLKIGIVWLGNPQHKRDHERSVPLDLWRPLTQLKGVRLFSMQFNAKPDDLKTLHEWGVTDLAPRIKDLADSAAFMAELDVLITVDSAPAHLAGALGLKNWVLLTLNPDWRWLLNREDSPWYPSTRLFRQPAAGDWKSVIAGVKAALDKERPGNH